MENGTEHCIEMTNDEYRNEIISIIKNIDDNNKLRFWYRYISAIENGED